MGDRIRDRTLVLKVLVPSLEARLREKLNDEMTNRKKNTTEDVLSDLEGVSCEPTKDGSTLWNFRCDGATYPGALLYCTVLWNVNHNHIYSHVSFILSFFCILARLVNLPCPGTFVSTVRATTIQSCWYLILVTFFSFLYFSPVEVHKTHDHAMYYKCVDIAQMLIVYEDEMALEEAEAGPKSEGFPSYYHSGLTPPMKRVVERRFEAREHKAVAPPRTEVAQVEYEMQELMDRIMSKESTRSKKTKSPATVATATKVIEDVVEDVVDYEPWMDDYGRQPHGIQFDEKDVLCTKHPELWLDPDEVAVIKSMEREKEREDAAIAAAIAAGAKKKKKAKRKKEKEEAAAKGSIKKGIPAKKNLEEVDEVTQAATQMSHLDANDILGDEFLADDYFNFGEDDPFADLEFA